VRGISLDDVPVAPEPEPERPVPAGMRLLPNVGLLTIDGHRALCERLGGQVITELDGVDVSDRCVEAHDGEGWATLWGVYEGHRLPPPVPHHGKVRFLLKRRGYRPMPRSGTYFYGSGPAWLDFGS
jgi:hypothetical protein